MGAAWWCPRCAEQRAFTRAGAQLCCIYFCRAHPPAFAETPGVVNCHLIAPLFPAPCRHGLGQLLWVRTEAEARRPSGRAAGGAACRGDAGLRRRDGVCAGGVCGSCEWHRPRDGLAGLAAGRGWTRLSQRSGIPSQKVFAGAGGPAWDKVGIRCFCPQQPLHLHSRGSAVFLLKDARTGESGAGQGQSCSLWRSLSFLSHRLCLFL